MLHQQRILQSKQGDSERSSPFQRVDALSKGISSPESGAPLDVSSLLQIFFVLLDLHENKLCMALIEHFGVSSLGQTLVPFKANQLQGCVYDFVMSAGTKHSKDGLHSLSQLVDVDAVRSGINSTKIHQRDQAKKVPSRASDPLKSSRGVRYASGDLDSVSQSLKVRAIRTGPSPGHGNGHSRLGNDGNLAANHAANAKPDASTGEHTSSGSGTIPVPDKTTSSHADKDTSSLPAALDQESSIQIVGMPFPPSQNEYKDNGKSNCTSENHSAPREEDEGKKGSAQPTVDGLCSETTPCPSPNKEEQHKTQPTEGEKENDISGGESIPTSASAKNKESPASSNVPTTAASQPLKNGPAQAATLDYLKPKPLSPPNTGTAANEDRNGKKKTPCTKGTAALKAILAAEALSNTGTAANQARSGKKGAPCTKGTLDAEAKSNTGTAANERKSGRKAAPSTKGTLDADALSNFAEMPGRRSEAERKGTASSKFRPGATRGTAPGTVDGAPRAPFGVQFSNSTEFADPSSRPVTQPGLMRRMANSMNRLVPQQRVTQTHTTVTDDFEQEVDSDSEEEEMDLNEDPVEFENGTLESGKIHGWNLEINEANSKHLAMPTGRWILHPGDRIRIAWDVLGFFLIIVECLTIPMTVAFDIELPTDWFLFSTVFFFIDMVASSITGYYENGVLVMRQSLIIRRYLKLFFIIDFVSTFPWYLVSQTSNWAAKVTRFAKLFRIARLLRLARLGDLLRRLQDLLPHTGLILSLLNTVVFFVIFCHWCACIWGFIGNPSKVEHSSASDPPYDYDRECEKGGPCEAGIVGSPWQRRYGLQSLTHSEKYLTALQFATGVITGGEAGMTAGCWLEHLYMIILMLVSFMLCSTILSKIVLFMQKINEDEAMLQDSLRVASDFMASRKLPLKLQTKIKRYLEFQHKSKKISLFAHYAFVDQLSPWLRLELTEQLNSEVLLRHPFFADLPRRTFKRVCAIAVTVLYAPGDLVTQKGNRAACMFFIVQGSLQVLIVHKQTYEMWDDEEVADDEDDAVLVAKYHTQIPRTRTESDRSLTQGFTSSSNESKKLEKNPAIEHENIILQSPSWIGDQCLFQDTVRKATVVACTHVELLTVGREDLLCLMSELPKLQKHYELWQKKLQPVSTNFSESQSFNEEEDLQDRRTKGCFNDEGDQDISIQGDHAGDQSILIGGDQDGDQDVNEAPQGHPDKIRWSKDSDALS